MCIIITKDAIPDSTRLINIPVKLNGKEKNLLIYTNDLTTKLSKKDNSNNELMIVAIPNVNNITNFGLVDVSTDEMKTFRKELFNACDDLKPKKKSKGLSRSFMLDGLNNKSYKLEVHDVGNYKISVAPSLDDLLDKTDWDKFNVSSNYKNKLDGLYDKEVYPLSNYAYIVASADKKIDDDGFGIIYDKFNNTTYFPTSHESKYPHENMRKFKYQNPDKNIQIPKSDPNENYYYNVKCYNCFVNVSDTYQYNKYNNDINKNRECIKNIDILTGRPLVLKDTELINEIFSNLSDTCVMSEGGNIESFYVNRSGFEHIDFMEINGYYDNINIGWENPEIIITMEDTKKNNENDTKEETQDFKSTLFQKIFSFWK